MIKSLGRVTMNLSLFLFNEQFKRTYTLLRAEFIYPKTRIITFCKQIILQIFCRFCYATFYLHNMQYCPIEK